MKKILILGGISLAMLFPQQIYAKNACASVLCLSGLLDGTARPSECRKPINDYFNIRKFKHGHWKIGRTIRARGSYLNQCPKGRTKAQVINAAFGAVWSM